MSIVFVSLFANLFWFRKRSKLVGWYILATISSEIACAIFILFALDEDWMKEKKAYIADVEQSHKIKTIPYKHIVFSGDDVVVWLGYEGTDYLVFVVQQKNNDRIPVLLYRKPKHHTYGEIDLRPLAPLLLKITNKDEGGITGAVIVLPPLSE